MSLLGDERQSKKSGDNNDIKDAAGYTIPTYPSLSLLNER